jgi:hypothetical protein
VASDFERLFACRDEAEGVQLELFGGHLSDDQVPVMDRIEGPSEEADHGPAQAPVALGQTSPAPWALGWNRRM